MFEQASIPNGPAAKRAWTTFAGFTSQALLLACMVLVPLISPQALPSAHLLTALEPPGPPPPPPPPPGEMQVVPVRHATTQFPDHVFTAPTSVPAIAQIIVDPPTAPAGVLDVQGGVPGGQQGGVPGGVLNSILEGVPRPAARPAEVVPTAPPPAASVIRRVTVGGLVKLAILVHRVEPPYPPLAKQARVSGEVHLEGVIGTDGRMKDLRVVSGPPLLVKAAYDAVIQWIYRPTTLNGDPVEVIAPITVTFHLN